MNLFIIAENKDNSNAILYWKTNRPSLGIFHNDNHWQSAAGSRNKENEPQIFLNVIINIFFLERSNIIEHVQNYV